MEVTAGGQGSKTRKKEASMSKEQGRREINTGSALRSTYHMHEWQDTEYINRIKKYVSK